MRTSPITYYHTVSKTLTTSDVQTENKKQNTIA
jgi:hypothetical protein